MVHSRCFLIFPESPLLLLLLEARHDEIPTAGGGGWWFRRKSEAGDSPAGGGERFYHCLPDLLGPVEAAAKGAAVDPFRTPNPGNALFRGASASGNCHEQRDRDAGRSGPLVQRMSRR